MQRYLILFVRYGIGVLLILTGFVLAVVAEGGVAAEAWAIFTGAGVSVLLLNALYRIGVQGEDERDREEEARSYFDEHGHWPDEAPPVRADESRGARRSPPSDPGRALPRPKPRRRPP